MPDHIILTAFGTTTRAKEAYHYLEERISLQFPRHTIHWAYSSPTVRRTSSTENSRLLSVGETLGSLDTSDPIVIQSLHVLPGREFERIRDEVHELGIQIAIGQPLLNESQDLRRFVSCLQNLIEDSGSNAVLLLGHGTDHPCRSIYGELERLLRERFGSRIFMSTLEFQEEPAEETITRIAAAGHKTAHIIPLLLVAGMHFFKDITGDHEDSWQNLCTKHGIDLQIHDKGLAVLPGIADIFCDHIRTAFNSSLS